MVPKKVKVAIDISRLHPEAMKRGVGFYAQNLSKALKRLNDSNQYTLKKFTREKTEADIIHFPYFDPFFLSLPAVRKQPTVVTIHDFTPLKFPQHFPSGFRGGIKWYIQKQIVKRVSAIVTDSYNSKKDIEKIVGYPAEKIFPIYLAADESFRKIQSASILRSIEAKYKLPAQFILYVGDLNWNKNVKSLVKAFNKLKAQNSKLKAKIQNLKLVFAGSAFKNDELVELREVKKLTKDIKIENDIRLLGFVPTKDLIAVYNLAILYVQPSFYEGFGLPVLEAMACGCPVLSSSKASLPEVGGQAVEYFDPLIKQGLEDKLINLIGDSDKLKFLRIQGLKQASKFSWKKTALETRKVYEEILSKE